MNEPATETTYTPPTLTVIDPDQDETAQVVTDEPTLTALEERRTSWLTTCGSWHEGSRWGYLYMGRREGLEVPHSPADARR